MNNQLKTILCIASVMLLAACASNDVGQLKDVNQDEVCQGYSVTYFEAENKTEVKVFLRFAGPNGTTLKLNGPGSLTLDGMELAENITQNEGCFYNKVFDGQMPSGNHVLAFTDYNGKKYTQKFDWNNMGIEPLPANINRKDGLKIFFTDDPEGRREDITVNVSDSAGTQTETFAHVHRDRLKFPDDKLANLHGKVEVSISRNGNFELKQHAHGGGYLYTTYQLAPQKAVITD